jgi:hypothetical protein
MSQEREKSVHVLVTLGKDGVLVGTSDTVPEAVLEKISEHDERPIIFCGTFDSMMMTTTTMPSVVRPFSFVYLPGTPMRDIVNCTGAGIYERIGLFKYIYIYIYKYLCCQFQVWYNFV